MPEIKLRIAPTIRETGRILAGAIRTAGWFLLPPLLLAMLLETSALQFGQAKSAGLIQLGAVLCGILPNWILTVLIVRARLGGRTGRMLFHVDRQASMLLGLLAVEPVVGLLFPTVVRTRWALPLAAAQLAFTLAWLRATLLLEVSWALGGVMTFAESWRGLAGNFIRVLVISVLWTLLFMGLAEAIALVATGKLLLPSVPGAARGFGIAGALSACIFVAFDAAIYRLLGHETRLGAPSPGPSPGLSPGLNAFDA